jgi:hypothetical protein
VYSLVAGRFFRGLLAISTQRIEYAEHSISDALGKNGQLQVDKQEARIRGETGMATIETNWAISP